MTLFAWPKKAAFGRVVPKARIYEHAGANSELKERFMHQVEQISWIYKLAPETVNLPATNAVTEIQVFQIQLKTTALDTAVLKAIDQAIPFPLFFELAHGERVKMTAAYKRPNEADGSRWMVSNYFETTWLEEKTPRQPLPMALDMARLYEQLLSPLVDTKLTYPAPPPAFPEIKDNSTSQLQAASASKNIECLSLEERIALADCIAAQRKAVEKIKLRLNREKQFNKRVAINAELREARQKLEQLTSQQRASARY